MKDFEICSGRYKRLCLLSISTFLFTLILRYFVNFYERYNEIGKLHEYFIYFVLIGTVMVLYISYLESRDRDPFITGKTQTFGVINSYTVSPIIVNILSLNLDFRIVIVSYFSLFVFSHFLGIYHSEK